MGLVGRTISALDAAELTQGRKVGVTGVFRSTYEGQPLEDRQRKLCDDSPFYLSDLTALFVNCTLKPSPEQSHTEGLATITTAIMEANDVTVDMVCAVDLDLPPGVQSDMTQHGAASDGWPALYNKVMAADILVLMTPI